MSLPPRLFTVLVGVLCLILMCPNAFAVTPEANQQDPSFANLDPWSLVFDEADDFSTDDSDEDLVVNSQSSSSTSTSSTFANPKQSPTRRSRSVFEEALDVRNEEIRSLQAATKPLVQLMVHHAFGSYSTAALGFDELTPISGKGKNTIGAYALTLIDSLDTLAVTGEHEVFQQATAWLRKTWDGDAPAGGAVDAEEEQERDKEHDPQQKFETWRERRRARLPNETEMAYSIRTAPSKCANIVQRIRKFEEHEQAAQQSPREQSMEEWFLAAELASLREGSADAELAEQTATEEEEEREGHELESKRRALLSELSSCTRDVRRKQQRARLLDSMFYQDRAVSVFETHIRIVGGLLSAHAMYTERIVPINPDIDPYDDDLFLEVAKFLAERLLPAFDTVLGMPYGSLNLRHGVLKGEIDITATAGVGTFLVEMIALSAWTGDPKFEDAARRATLSVLQCREAWTNLLGNHINITSGQWTLEQSSIGTGIDSLIEYLPKAYAMTADPLYLELFHITHDALRRLTRMGPWFSEASCRSGDPLPGMYNSLASFYAGNLAWTGTYGMRSRPPEGELNTLHRVQEARHGAGFERKPAPTCPMPPRFSSERLDNNDEVPWTSERYSYARTLWDEEAVDGGGGNLFFDADNEYGDVVTNFFAKRRSAERERQKKERNEATATTTSSDDGGDEKEVETIRDRLSHVVASMIDRTMEELHHPHHQERSDATLGASPKRRPRSVIPNHDAQKDQRLFDGDGSLFPLLDEAVESAHAAQSILSRFGAFPEGFQLHFSSPAEGQKGFPLRPEHAEALYFLFRKTRDPSYLIMGQEFVNALWIRSATWCGFATLHDVGLPASNKHCFQDAMESFLISETLKYLYLLFDDDETSRFHQAERRLLWQDPRDASDAEEEEEEQRDVGDRKIQDPTLRNADEEKFQSVGWVFTTEGHPLPIIPRMHWYRRFPLTTEENDDEWNDLLANASSHPHRHHPAYRPFPSTTDTSAPLSSSLQEEESSTCQQIESEDEETGNDVEQPPWASQLPPWEDEFETAIHDTLASIRRVRWLESSIRRRDVLMSMKQSYSASPFGGGGVPIAFQMADGQLIDGINHPAGSGVSGGVTDVLIQALMKAVGMKASSDAPPSSSSSSQPTQLHMDALKKILVQSPVSFGGAAPNGAAATPQRDSQKESSKHPSPTEETPKEFPVDALDESDPLDQENEEEEGAADRTGNAFGPSASETEQQQRQGATQKEAEKTRRSPISSLSSSPTPEWIAEWKAKLPLPYDPLDSTGVWIHPSRVLVQDMVPSLNPRFVCAGGSYGGDVRSKLDVDYLPSNLFHFQVE